MSFNIILTFRVNCKNSLWNLVVIFNFRGGSTFYFRPILHSFPSELRSLQRTKTILRDRVPFYQEKEAVFEVILSTCSEFSQIGTPHFSLEGVRVNSRNVSFSCARQLLAFYYASLSFVSDVTAGGVCMWSLSQGYSAVIHNNLVA